MDSLFKSIGACRLPGVLLDKLNKIREFVRNPLALPLMFS